MTTTGETSGHRSGARLHESGGRHARALGLAIATACAAVIGLLAPERLDAQYFGRNKVNYERFDWRILKTASFDLHFYPQERAVAEEAARLSERWYERHAELLGHRPTRKSLFFYADHPDFQQTNVIESQLSEGTGGVTEGLRTRVIMPFTGVRADDDHVLGHELVHVFQYSLADAPGNGGLGALGALPLWIVEGMAEYLSLGRVDPLTAMWLRDATLRDRLPTLKQLTTDQRFFPYRYGHAFWAYIGATYGDTAVRDIFRRSLRGGGLERAIRATTGISSDSLSKAWIARIRADYTPVMAGRTRPEGAGDRLLGGRGSEQMNVSPVQSPDGQYVAFFSQRGLFSVDLWVADATTGRIVKRLSGPRTDNHFDAVSFISSAATWSPDGRKMAYVVFAEGDHEVAILDVRSGDVERRVAIPGVPAINTVAWSPDGRALAISGQVGGQSDLYVYDLESRAVRRLTNDRTAEIHPSWSPDGRSIAVATDRGEEFDDARLTSGKMRLAVVDATSGELRLLPAIEGAKMINPQWSPDGRELFFVSDRGGFSDVYRIEVGSGRLHQVTRLATGVSGISANSPALSVARTTGRLVFSVFENQGYSVYALDAGRARGLPVEEAPAIALAAGTVSAAVLPPATATGGIVATALSSPLEGLPAPSTTYPETGYSRRLSLEAIGQPSLGVATGGAFGTQIGGGASAFFGDQLGDRRLGVALQAQGRLQDIGGQLLYRNSGQRLNWVLFGGRTPIASGYAYAEPTTVTMGGREFRGERISQVLQRIYYDQIGAVLQYPFSQTRRAELQVTGNRISSDVEIQRVVAVGGEVVNESRKDTTSFGTANYAQAAAAYVGDNSVFGFTSPVQGARYRVEAGPTFGSAIFNTLLVDYRRYLFLRPVTFAMRGMGFGRFGRDSDNGTISPLFIGQPTLVRGYQQETFSAAECTVGRGDPNDPVSACPEFARLVGSRIAVASAELRIPLLGTRDLGVIATNFLPLEIAPFIDGGVAWRSDSRPTLDFDRNSAGRVPVFSGGIAARTNLFGFAIIEGFYARPWQRNVGGVFGINLAPGW